MNKDERKCYYLGCRSWAGAVGPTPLYECSACKRLACDGCSKDHMIHCDATYRIPSMTKVRDHAYIEAMKVNNA